jgi:hypothetical protein
VLEVGFEVDVELDGSDPIVDDDVRVQAWTLQASAGDRHVFELDSDPLDPILYLAVPGLGDPLVDDDSGASMNSRLEVTAPESGTLTVYVGALDEGIGPIRVRVMRRRD